MAEDTEDTAAAPRDPAAELAAALRDTAAALRLIRQEVHVFGLEMRAGFAEARADLA